MIYIWYLNNNPSLFPLSHFLFSASHGTGEDSGSLPYRLQELAEQHGEEARSARDGESLLRTQDGAGV